ncbi:MAG: ribbon-helix-helix domain-containing protein [Sandaracinaceae bacterium]|nr:ribbon-helix-helix domain-containing protein [Sandaracinaceae bacterium]
MSYTLTVRIDEELAARLEEAASRANEPVSAVVRRAVTAFLGEQTGRSAKTLLAAAGSLRGAGVSATNENVRSSFQKRRRGRA